MRAWLTSTWRTRRSWLVCAASCAVVGLVCCFVPLFDVLGYESAALFGALLGFASLWLTSSGMRAHERAPLEERAGGFAWVLERAARVLCLALIPLGLLTLNMLRVRNCDPLTGLGFWALIPTGSVLLCAALAWCLGLVAPRSHAWRVGLGVAAILANAAWFGWSLAAEPTIVGNQWLIGYFSGSIYDEALAIPRALGWYRLCGALAVASALAGVEFVRRVWRAERAARAGLVAALFCAAWFGAVLVEEDYDIDIDRDEIIEELGASIETEHCRIFHPSTQRFAQLAPLLARDCEFRYAELAEYLRTDPVEYLGRKVRVFVYASTSQKGRLMGARRTLIAKIWLGEIHITWSGVGDHLLAHELAHVFSAPFGSGPFKVSVQNGVGVNMGLVEGLATAADWPASEMTPHEASAAMRRLGIAPDLGRLVGAAGFWTQASGKAYTLMGSFVRWLIDTRGIDAFKLVYANGDFEAAYGTSGAELVREWGVFVDGIEPTPRQTKLATFRYTRPSIFGKVCARAVAERRRLAGKAASAGNHARASELWEQVAGFSASASDSVAWARALERAREPERARAILDELLARELSPSERARALHAAGDIEWAGGERERADEAYASCLELGVSDATERQLAVKRLALEQDDPAWARRYLVERPSPDIAIYEPLARLSDEPDDALASYLLGRRLYQSGRWAEAVEHLERARASVRSRALADESSWLIGMASWIAGDSARARRAFERLGRPGVSSRLREHAIEGLDRVRLTPAQE